jgi:hypothetical protein
MDQWRDFGVVRARSSDCPTFQGKADQGRSSRLWFRHGPQTVRFRSGFGPVSGRLPAGYRSLAQQLRLTTLLSA